MIDITLDGYLDVKEIEDNDIFKNKIPDYILSNLKETFEIRPYQREAIGRFVYYWENRDNLKYKKIAAKNHLLFQMATGSGKTLVMAALMIFLYKQGYRNFLFFVPSVSIIRKTKENFLNSLCGKYLFAKEVKIDNRKVEIKEVNSFQRADTDCINICFLTDQGLSERINNTVEDAICLEDFKEKTVLIGDESHHNNANTKNKELEKKKLTKTERDVKSWEDSIRQAFEANKENVLLEFTATANLDNSFVEDKYRDKLIFDYSLKQFKNDGYSKDIISYSVNNDDVFERTLHALIINQYRYLLFSDKQLNIKPVVMFKAPKKIEESIEFQKKFSELLESKDFIAKIKVIFDSVQKETDNPTLFKIKGYIKSIDSFAESIRRDFAPEYQISVNSKDDSEEKQIIINSLEEPNNHYRAVFAVDKLNEGWDVLNLFDIVRLSDEVKNGTVQEAQLIGRGARYCPFIIDKGSRYMRKYDDDVTNECRIFEEMYYYTKEDSDYLNNLNTELERIGVGKIGNKKEPIVKELRVKDDFKNSNLYKNGSIYLNNRINRTDEEINSINEDIIKFEYVVDILDGKVITNSLLEEQITELSTEGKDAKQIPLSDLGARIIRKALLKQTYYKFDHLKELFPSLESIDQFMGEDKFLKNIKVKIQGGKDITELSQKQKLSIAEEVLSKVAKGIGEKPVKYKGSKEFSGFSLSKNFVDKTLNFSPKSSGSEAEIGLSMKESRDYRLDLSKKVWYAQSDCFGTSEEKSLVYYIDSVYNRLKSKFPDKEIYLLRNEHHFTIYSFKDGQPFEPDFILMISKKTEQEVFQYQLFIEPKGEHLVKKDQWKEDFLKQIKAIKPYEDNNIIIWGLPFYTKGKERGDVKFAKAFEEILQLSGVTANPEEESEDIEEQDIISDLNMIKDMVKGWTDDQKKQLIKELGFSLESE